MSTAAGKIFFSRLFFWVVFAVAGLFYLFPNLFKLNTDHRFAMSRIKLGIDLRGGTYITLGVEVEKALENRLAQENKMLELVFKKRLNLKPKHKEITQNSIIITFETDEAAQACYNFLKNEALDLRSSLDGKTVTVKLSPAQEAGIKNDSVEQAIQVIENRLLSLGVEGIVVQRHGNRQIVVQIPGVDDPKRVKDLITRRAHLEF